MAPIILLIEEKARKILFSCFVVRSSFIASKSKRDHRAASEPVTRALALHTLPGLLISFAINGVERANSSSRIDVVVAQRLIGLTVARAQCRKMFPTTSDESRLATIINNRPAGRATSQFNPTTTSASGNMSSHHNQFSQANFSLGYWFVSV